VNEVRLESAGIKEKCLDITSKSDPVWDREQVIQLIEPLLELIELGDELYKSSEELCEFQDKIIKKHILVDSIQLMMSCGLILIVSIILLI